MENLPIKAYNEIRKARGSFNDLKTAIDQHESKYPLVVNYLYAKHCYIHSNYFNAAQWIDKAISILNTDVISNLSSPIKKQEIYLLAGEIYANNNEEEKALKAFQRYQLLVSRTRRINEGSNEYLSFRNYPGYSLSDLRNNAITVSPPKNMNDPYDTLVLKWGEYLKANKKNKRHIPYFCKSLDYYRIRSFTRLKSTDGNSQDMVNNILMWSHYGGQHSGYCIKYHFSDNFLRQSTDSTTVRFKGVIYYDKNDPLRLNKSTLTTDITLCTKHPVWKYENEVRLIAYNIDKNEDYYQIKLDADSYIDSIYFGYRCPKERIDKIKQILSNCSEIKYYKMKSSFDDIYNLTPEEL